MCCCSETTRERAREIDMQERRRKIAEAELDRKMIEQKEIEMNDCANSSSCSTFMQNGIKFSFR